MQNDLKNIKVQTFGWASLVSLVGFAVTLFVIAAHLLGPIKSELGLVSGQVSEISDLHQFTYTLLREECNVSLAHRVDSNRRLMVIERTLDRLESRLFKVESTFKDLED